VAVAGIEKKLGWHDDRRASPVCAAPSARATTRTRLVAAGQRQATCCFSFASMV